MKNLKEQKPETEVVQAVDVELNEEQSDVVAGGVWGDCTGGSIPTFPTKPTGFPDVHLPHATDANESV